MPADLEADAPHMITIRAIGALGSRLGPSTSRAVSRSDEDAETVPLADLAGTPNRFVARLDQYVGAHYLRLLGLALLSCYLVYGLVESKNLVDSLLRTQQSMTLLPTLFRSHYYDRKIIERLKSKEIRRVVSEAVTIGASAPDALRPILEEMAEMYEGDIADVDPLLYAPRRSGRSADSPRPLS